MISGSRQNKVDQSTRLTLRIHRGRRSNSVPRVSSLGTEYQLTSSKSADTTSLDRRYKCASAKIERVKEYDVDHLTNKSPILHMMQITLNRKENMETFLCNDPTKTDNITKTESVKAKKGVGKRILKVQAKRFKVETKAAKTLAIIVGGFICCWLPFFSVYLIRAFCKNCIQPLIFSILFWLGYCNSAINPLIYALFSKDFRLAFKNLICKCLCAQYIANKQTSSYNSANGR